MNPPGKFSQSSGCLGLLLMLFTGTKCARCGKRRWSGMRREHVGGRYRDVCGHSCQINPNQNSFKK